MTVSQLLASIPKRKREDGIWLLSSLLGVTRSGLLFNGDRALDESFMKRWRKLWARRLAGEPLQYVVGSAPFYGREFLVSGRVLIPRPETESLVELSLSLLAGKQEARVLDIGTGSGAIAITLKLERPSLQLTATDVSATALGMAKKNATALGAGIDFLKRDLFSPSLQKQAWDLVVSNPPYLDFSKDKVANDVQEWEPRIALEPLRAARIASVKERAAWCAERILLGCSKAEVAFTALELSPRVAAILEKKWRSHERVARAWRAPDLAGRKRFLLVAWKNA